VCAAANDVLDMLTRTRLQAVSVTAVGNLMLKAVAGRLPLAPYCKPGYVLDAFNASTSWLNATNQNTTWTVGMPGMPLLFVRARLTGDRRS
jgi:hypothetical protein